MHPWEKQERTTFLEFIPRPTPSSSYRFITYSYSVARGKVALSAYKRFSLSFSLSVFLRFQKLQCTCTLFIDVIRSSFDFLTKRNRDILSNRIFKDLSNIYIYIFSPFSLDRSSSQSGNIGVFRDI